MSDPRRDRKRAGVPATDLIEQAISLLRRAPASALLSFYIGAVPFWLALLYFLSDMSRGADAEARLPGASLAVAALYIWMKCWQAIFAAQLRSVLLDEPAAPWTGPRLLRLILLHATMQPWGLIARLLAQLVTIPFVWVASFYHNVTVLADGQPDISRRAAAQARLWPLQAHGIFSQLSILGLFIWLNFVALLIFAPALLKTFLGIDTMFSRSLSAYVNTTFFTATGALTMLCLDPLWKATYVLRCFYGESLRTGRDLTVALKRARRAVPIALAILFTLVATPAPLRAAQPPVPSAPVAPAELDRRIDDVLQRREYTWRAPREKVTEARKGWLDSWLEGVGKTIRGWIASLQKNAERFFRWLFERWLGTESSGRDGEGHAWGAGARALVWAALALSIGFLAWALWRSLRGKRVPLAVAQPITAVPDLHAPDVAADELPEDGWLQLARDLAARGELSLALRAMWLAGLAHLGHRDLLRIARHKSNREYARELQRRARSRDQLLTAFDDNLAAFERAWYGKHEVTRAIFDQCVGNLERMRAC